MIADAAELCLGEGLFADPRMAMRRHDEVGTVSDFGRGDETGILLHDDPDAGSPGGRSQPVFRIGHHDPDDIDTMLAQHVECGHAKMAGADQGEPRGLVPSWRKYLAP